MAYLLLYLVLISLVAVGLTARDKRAARRGARRVPERTLLAVAVLGGAAVMLAAMRAIRHKTQHPKFMVGLPVIIVLQVAIVYLFWRGYL